MRSFSVGDRIQFTAPANDLRVANRELETVISQSVAEARPVSRLYDRVSRRASPGLDTDLSGLGLSSIYPGECQIFL